MPHGIIDNRRAGGVRKLILWGGLLLVLGVVNAMIAGKERTLAEGSTVLLELAPRDPRSLLQGDYMTLRYAISEQVSRALGDGSASGRLLVHVDADGVARYLGVYRDGDALAPDQRLLYFRKRDRTVRLAGDAFFFQEGQGGYYATARYGEVRVDKDGHAILVGLRDGERRPLNTPDNSLGDG